MRLLGIVSDRRFPVFSASCRDSGAVRDVLAEHGDPAYSSLGRLRQLQTTAVVPALSGAGGGFRFGSHLLC